MGDNNQLEVVVLLGTHPYCGENTLLHIHSREFKECNHSGHPSFQLENLFPSHRAQICMADLGSVECN